jgi:hypothetical protein
VTCPRSGPQTELQWEAEFGRAAQEEKEKMAELRRITLLHGFSSPNVAMVRHAVPRSHIASLFLVIEGLAFHRRPRRSRKSLFSRRRSRGRPRRRSLSQVGRCRLCSF